MTVFYKETFASRENTSYYNRSYFNNDEYDERMGTNATNDTEYKSILNFLRDGDRKSSP